MDPKLQARIADKMPKFNPDLARGIACKQLADADVYIENDLRSSAEHFHADIKFVELRRLTPMEEYRALHPRKDKNYIELSKSSTVLVEAHYEYNGKPIDPRPLAVPFADIGGLVWLLGTEYAVSPVIEDAAVSVTRGGLFAWLGMTKSNFSRFNHHFLIDGVTHTANVTYSFLYHVGPRSKAVKPGKNAPRPTLMNYLMCKFGFKEVLTRFFDISDVHVGTVEDITVDKYPKEHWAIISSASTNSIRRKDGKAGSNIAIAVLKAQLIPAVVDALCSFFYTVDVFPDMIRAEDLDKPLLWKRILGIITFSERLPEGERLKLIDDHMITIDGYINYQSRNNLKQGGIEVNDFFELLVWVIYNLPSRVSTGSGEVASLYGKRLTVTRYLLKDLSRSIYTLMFALNKRFNNRRGRLSERDVKEIMRKGLPRDKILDASSGHAEVATVSFPGTCMIYDITSNAVLQESTDNAPGKSGGGITDASKFIHSSVVAFCSYAAMGKNEPSGRGNLNMCVDLGPRGEFIENEANKPVLHKLDMQLTRL